MIQIAHHIPLPEIQPRGNTAPRVETVSNSGEYDDLNQTELTFRLSRMEVGDSIAVNYDRIDKIRVNISTYGKRNHKRYSVRKWKDGYRCWRVE